MIESLYESHTYNMWLAEIVYHVAFRYKKPHARLLNVKAVRQSFSWSTYRRLPDNAQVQSCPQCTAVEDGSMQPLCLKRFRHHARTERHSCWVSTNSNLDFVQQQKVFFSLRRINSITFGKFYTHLTSLKLCCQVKELISSV